MAKSRGSSKSEARRGHARRQRDKEPEPQGARDRPQSQGRFPKVPVVALVVLGILAIVVLGILAIVVIFATTSGNSGRAEKGSTLSAPGYEVGAEISLTETPTATPTTIPTATPTTIPTADPDATPTSTPTLMERVEQTEQAVAELTERVQELEAATVSSPETIVTVVTGDTLWDLMTGANGEYPTWEEINSVAEANGLSSSINESGDLIVLIYPGQTIDLALAG